MHVIDASTAIKAPQLDGAAKANPPPTKIKTWPGGIINSATVLENTPTRSHAPMLLIQLLTIVINRSEMTKGLYIRMNEAHTPFYIHFVLTSLIISTVYWAFGLCFMIADLTERPKWLMQYKVQPWKRIGPKEYTKICLIVLRNQVLVNIPLSFIVGKWIAPWRGMRTDLPLPGVLETMGTWWFSLMCTEIGFFYVHKLFHTPNFYTRFHKKHHEYTAPVALASTYCTLVEHLFSNIMPILLGLIILGSHWSLIIMYFCDLSIGTLSTHSGYNIPYWHRSLTHDYHHFSFNENFGPVGILDAIYGTSKNFRRVMDEALARNGGDYTKASREVANSIAQWEAEREAQEQATSQEPTVVN
ncbi:hypothetical protein FRB94_008980 [Tulasnella sp. JGI-2019a]|nr:hypothetical protein FRB93_003490 [Tulasnella sp. JGI-2019a]KAG9014822.1 hypothetical protein FRB94_008980 [Tulasnella sp. JGI-2019a]KAG9040017.1 hypothetical protein FRB95_004489 [Tulasnella sp. JGI-2019a]